MPNLPISQLPELTASALTSNAEFAVAQDGTTYKVKSGNLSPFRFQYGLFTQTGSSETVSGTTEQSIIGGGIGTLGVGANQFNVGDTFQAIIAGHLANNNDFLQIRVKSDSIALADSGSIQYNTSGDETLMNLELNFIILQTGGTGNASILTKGLLTTVKNSNFTVNGYSFESINNTTFDTTISNTLDVTMQFNATDIQTYIYTDFFVLSKIY
jgi:hypothetical protein